MNASLEANELRYQEEIKPPVPPPPEVIRLPVQTPSPRLQKMQYGIRDQSEKYWESHESDFGYPLDERRVLQKRLSARRALHDPPREVGSDVPPPVGSVRENRRGSAFMTEPIVPMMVDDVHVEHLRVEPERIDFGMVPKGSSAVATLRFANTGIRPIHFHFTQIPNPDIRIMTLSGVVFPGLKVAVKIVVDKKAPPQKVRTEFTMMIGPSERAIPLSIEIVDENEVQAE
jgi:hypothetical protein